MVTTTFSVRAPRTASLAFYTGAGNRSAFQLEAELEYPNEMAELRSHLSEWRKRLKGYRR